MQKLPTHRYTIKIAGASGQGINSVGEILALALKRSGYSVFAYREYPSLIKGGHASYQIDFSDKPVSSSTIGVDLLVVMNKQATKWHLDEVNSGGIILHDFDNPRINADEARLMKEKEIKLLYIPALKLAKEVGGNELVTNIVSLAYVWKLLQLDIDKLRDVVNTKFADKPKYLAIDLACVDQAYKYELSDLPDYKRRIIKPDEVSPEEKSELHTTDQASVMDGIKLPAGQERYKDGYLITGNEALAIGAVNAGVRIHYAYPMTPSSSILDYLAEKASETGMIVKQAEDEITAAAMAIGSMHAGTRALTATSGGGFDLMTEHISLAAITEIPFVCVLAQRPGPATGLPTWTTQGDLMLAVFSAHGEYARCVIAVKDPEDAFLSIQEAFNIAEKYQIPVVLLTDKLVAETNYSISSFDQNAISVDRGELITDPASLANLLPTDRYKLTESGISPRWLPGAHAADFNANSDEHDEEGNVTEEANASSDMIEKRIRKEKTLLNTLPEPELHFNNVDLAATNGKLSFVGWGSSWGVMQDVMNYYETFGIKVDYLHFKYIWPLRTELLTDYLSKNENVILIEGNHNAQLAQLIRMQTGIEISTKLLKWDGRPFFLEDVIRFVEDNNLLKHS